MKLLAKIFLMLLLLAAGAAAYLWYSIEKPYQKFTSDGVFVNIPKGASRRAAARILEREGVVRSAIAFEIYARRHPRRTLQAGEYFFRAPATGKDVFWTLANGNVYAQPFTVLEGQTIFDIAQDLQTSKFMLADDFVKAAGDPAAVQDIAPQAKTLEGFLFPATYHLPRHPAPAELTAEMVKKFKEEWAHIAPATHESSQSVTSVVTLASLVERETPRPEERPLVASVFENRLRKNMLMQCDPTVVYALQQAGRYNGTLSTKDLHFDSPYNTYVHSGLPPGPIGNPGEASLRAALQPAQSDYLYFVANTQGGHFFGATLAEHNKNVLKYHRLLAGLPADPPPTPAAPKKPRAKKLRKGAAR